ncbi:MAG: hypothetical protein KBF26_02125 [Opitutaceae bacterium]|nr:hypothetical protein [Opitutaceae bacterium]
MPGPSSSRFPRWLIRLAIAAGILGLTIALFTPAREAMDVQLDASNYGSYAYFTARDFAYGPEVVPMAGPYGFVHYGGTYAGFLFWKRFGLELFSKAVLAGLIVWLSLQATRQPFLRWAWLLPVAIFFPFIDDLPSTLAIMLAGLCLVHHHPIASRRALLVCCASAGYLGFLTLSKGTHTVLAVGTLGLVCMQTLILRDFRRLPWIFAAYLGSVVGFLLAAGQNPLNFPSYVLGVLELSSGYNAAMGLDEPRDLFLRGLALFLCLLALLFVCTWPRRRNPSALAGGLLLAGYAFIFWKHGFVRSDGHVLIFFQLSYVSALMALLFFSLREETPPSWRWRAPAGVLAAIIVALGLWAEGSYTAIRHRWMLEATPRRLATAWDQITAPARARAQLDVALSQKRDDYQLPHMKLLAGNQRVDFFGIELGYLLLNRFNYHPRPVGGGNFSVFTPKLHDLNVAFMRDPDRRPEFVVADPQTIDERFPAQDDAGTLRVLLADYVPVESSAGLLFLQARPGPSRLAEPTLIRTDPLPLDTVIEVPHLSEHEMLLVSFSLPLNLRGRLRAMAYKPPPVFMDLGGEGINHPADRRIIPGMFQRPVPFSPVIEDVYGLQEFYEGSTGRTVKNYRIKTPQPEYFDTAAMTVSYYKVPRPASVPRVPLRIDNPHISREEPVKMAAFLSPISREEGRIAQVIVPPGFMAFALQGNETQFIFTCGMTTPSYDLPTDGVDIWVEMVRPGLPPQVIYQWNLNPRRRPAEKGAHRIELTLPPAPAGSLLYVQVGRGPDRNGAWDLAFFTGIEFRRGPFIAEQFPGFDTLPVAVTANVCGPGYAQGRTLFNLYAPGELTFKLKGTEKKLVFAGGVMPEAYTQGSSSDGVEFQAELRPVVGPTRMLTRYYCNPRDNVADRQDCTLEADLSAAKPGDTLILRVTPGPHGHEGWDWSFLTRVNLQ